MFLKVLLIVFVLYEFSLSYKILVGFPYPRKSHQILGEGVVRHLLDAGHEVTYITPVERKGHEKLRQINVSSISDHDLAEKSINFKKFLGRRANMNLNVHRYNFFFPSSNKTVFHENVQKLIHDPNEAFDAVIVEWMFVELFGSGLAAVFDCPLIWLTPMEITNHGLTLIRSSMNPAYTISRLPEEDPPFTFWTRIVELYSLCKYHADQWLSNSLEEDLFRKAFGASVAMRGRVLPSYYEARYNASLVLANSHVSTSFAAYIPQNFKQIGGYHIEDVLEPLPEDLKKHMDQSEYGVIYFSLGSILNTKDTPDVIKKGLMKVFGDLKQTVIWKTSSNFTDVSPNVHLLEWAPQQSILAHKNCILFITHGGLLSMNEAIHSGVPIIGIPLFADQFINIKRAVAKGFGKEVSATMNIARDLKAALDDVLGNSSYTEKSKEYSWIHKHRLVPPGRELVFWVEQVARTKGAAHLRPRAFALPLYQTLYLDFLLLLLLIFYAMIRGIRFLLVYVRNTVKLKTE